MSFISVLKKIGTVALGVERIAAPVLQFVPGAAPVLAIVDNITAHFQNLVVTAEVNNPTDGQGSVKAQSVQNDFAAGLEFTQSILAVKGEKLTYDTGALQEAIDAQVKAYNSIAKVKASFKVEKI